MAAKSEFVKVEKFEEYAMIRLDRPHRKNGIISEMYESIGSHLKLFAEDPALKFVVLTGTGEYFTSGADLAAQRNNTVEEGLAAFKNFVDSLLRFPKPIVVAVNGPAIGIGVSCLPLCDVVYAADNATFLTPFSRIGAAPEACSSVTFPKLMGYAKANEMLLFNRVLSAQEALQAGLVSDVFAKETFRSEVQKRIDEFVDNPALSLLYGKRLLREHELEQLLEVNAREVDRLRERFTSVDAALQAAKFVKRRSEINAARRRNTSKL